MNNKKLLIKKKDIYIYILHYNIRVICNITKVEFVSIKMYLLLYYRTIVLDLI